MIYGAEFIMIYNPAVNQSSLLHNVDLRAYKYDVGGQDIAGS